MKLETERLILRDLKESDAKFMAKYVNNPELCKYVPPIKLPYGLKDAKEFLKMCKKYIKTGTREHYVMGIELKENPEIIGVIEISYDEFAKTSQLDYALNQQYWGKGIMTEAAREIMKFAFNKLNVRKMTCPILSDNKASIALAIKLGFRLEGVLRAQARVKSTNEIHDKNIYGLLKEEWQDGK